jgi:hypothetical protein
MDDNYYTKPALSQSIIASFSSVSCELGQKQDYKPPTITITKGTVVGELFQQSYLLVAPRWLCVMGECRESKCGANLLGAQHLALLVTDTP